MGFPVEMFTVLAIRVLPAWQELLADPDQKISARQWYTDSTRLRARHRPLIRRPAPWAGFVPP